jgi:hypothetical protein
VIDFLFILHLLSLDTSRSLDLNSLVFVMIVIFKNSIKLHFISRLMITKKSIRFCNCSDIVVCISFSFCNRTPLKDLNFSFFLQKMDYNRNVDIKRHW